MEWLLMCDNTPKENDNVVIITTGGSGYNAVFKNNYFVVSEQYKISTNEVMYWKKADGDFSEEMNKPCRACGRSR